MPASLLKTSFTGGEWSPTLYGRTDLQKYASACRTLKNFIIHPHGGASNRGGTEFIHEIKSSSAKSRLVSFQFSVIQSYILEFGNLYVRFYRDGGIIVQTLADTTAWVTSTSYVIGDLRKENSIIYYCTTAHTSGTFATDLAAGKWYTLTAGATAGEFIYEIPTTYITADLPLLKFVQSADIIYVTHPSYPPRKIGRTAHTAWTISTITFQASILPPTLSGGTTYVVTTVSSVTGEESIASGATNANPISWSAITNADYYNVYKWDGGSHGWIGKANSTSFTEPIATITPDATKQPPTGYNPFDGANKYPGCAMFHEQRLLFARTNNQPQTIWGSVTGSFESMNKTSPSQDDDSYEYTINARQVNEIRFLLPLQELIVGTASGEWTMSAGSQADAITPSAISIKNQTYWGVSHLAPLTMGNSAIFIEGSGDMIRDLVYSLEQDGYAGNSLTILSNHLFEDKQIIAWCYQQHPDSIVWCVMDDGDLIGMTYYREQQVIGWHRHETDGEFESIASISTGEGVDDVYAIVKRTIGGNTKRYVEKFAKRITDSDVEQCFFLDCALTYNSTPATTFSGLGHLEGETVSAYADGSVYAGLTVASGAVTLPLASSIVYIGLPYECQIETLDFDMQSQQGATIQDKLRNIRSVVLRLKDTRELFVGPSTDRLYEIPFRTTELWGEPTNLYTGDKEVFLAEGDGRSSRVIIQVNNPVPITVLSLTARVEYGED